MYGLYVCLFVYASRVAHRAYMYVCIIVIVTHYNQQLKHYIQWKKKGMCERHCISFYIIKCITVFYSNSKSAQWYLYINAPLFCCTIGIALFIYILFWLLNFTNKSSWRFALHHCKKKGRVLAVHTAAGNK